MRAACEPMALLPAGARTGTPPCVNHRRAIVGQGEDVQNCSIRIGRVCLSGRHRGSGGPSPKRVKGYG